jgi:hypothetical protein
LSFDFDDRIGGLRGLRSSEEPLPDAAEAALFRLIIPAERWQSRYADARGQACQIEGGAELEARDVAVPEPG